MEITNTNQKVKWGLIGMGIGGVLAVGGASLVKLGHPLIGLICIGLGAIAWFVLPKVGLIRSKEGGKLIPSIGKIATTSNETVRVKTSYKDNTIHHNGNTVTKIYRISGSPMNINVWRRWMKLVVPPKDSNTTITIMELADLQSAVFQHTEHWSNEILREGNRDRRIKIFEYVNDLLRHYYRIPDRVPIIAITGDEKNVERVNPGVLNMKALPLDVKRFIHLMEGRTEKGDEL